MMALQVPLLHIGTASYIQVERVRTSIRHLADLSGNFARDDALLSLDRSNLQTRVLRLLEHFMPVKSVERLGSILTCNFGVKKNRGTSWMKVYKTGDIIDFGVNDDPLWPIRSRLVENQAIG